MLGINTEGRCDVTGMTATGIPPFIDIARQLCSLTAQHKKLQAICAENHEVVMERLPRKVCEALRDHYDIVGVQQMSRSEFQEMARSIAYTLREEFAATQPQLQVPVVQPMVQDPSTVLQHAVQHKIKTPEDRKTGYKT
mgnify:CR=1 FL=1